MDSGILANSGDIKKYQQIEEDCLSQLKLLIQENGELQDFEEFFDKKFLLHFIRGKKFNPEKALKTLESYMYVRRVKYKSFFKTLSSNSIGANKGMLQVLKHRDHLNRLVLVDQARFWDPAKVSIEECFKIYILVLEEIWNIEEAEMNGVVIIMDMANWNFQQIKALPPTEIMKAANLFVNNIPLRYGGIHIVNEYLLFSLLLKIVKPAFPKKLQERLHLHSSNLESLHAQVPPEILPEFLGGKISDEDAFDENFENGIQAKEEYYKKFTERL